VRGGRHDEGDHHGCWDPDAGELLVIDPIQRRFQYRITAPMFRFHRGTIDVIDLDDGTCVVTYQTEADPRALALTIAGGTAGALDELRRQLDTHDDMGGAG
jgi:hypothetical protein